MRWRRHLLGRRAPLALLGAAALAVALAQGRPTASSPPGAAAELAAREGVRLDGGSFRWLYPDRVGDAGPFDWSPAVFLARSRASALRDVFTAELRVDAGGVPVEMRRLTNLSRTDDRDEDVLEVSARGRAAFAGRVGPTYNSVSTLDFRGESPALTADWPRGWRLANRISNLQRTGRTEGVQWRTYVFRDPPARLALEFVDGAALAVRAGDRPAFAIGADGSATAADVVVQEMLKGRPALLAWAVDTAREVPWIGRRKIEWAEKFWFDFNDWLARKRYEVLGEEEGGGAAAEYAAMVAARPSVGLAGWPPAAIAPVLRKPQPGEGQWAPVQDELFTPQVAGPPLFYRTFVRTDPERPFAVTHLIAWDPARVELRMMAGVREPVSTTGLKGLGEVPREGPRGGEIARLVGAFNGAFQALHGEWGMAIDRQYYLPPRPYGATVATYDDGQTAMGTWPEPAPPMPDRMRDLRQNVQPLVEGGAINPYKRVWWGGVPAGIEERVVTARSGICLTTGRKLVYFWGEHLSPESLGAAMLAAGCDYGIHLDMNTGHCGFELYRVDEKGRQPAAGRALDGNGEAEGDVPRRPDLVFRAKKLAREMAHMRFPRYVARDPRDFFYLLLRPSVFDRPPAAAPGGGWQPVGAAEGVPVPLVRAELGVGRVLYKVDVEQVVFALEDREPEGALLALPFATRAAGVSTGVKWGGRALAPMQGGESAICFDGEGGARADLAPEGAAGAIQGLSVNAAKLVPSEHAIGFDEEGYLVIGASAGGAADLGALLGGVGVGDVIVLIARGDDPEVGAAIRWLVLRARPRPAAFRIFEEVRPVPPSVWREVYRRQGSLLNNGDGEQ